jgi:hypothetical protein
MNNLKYIFVVVSLLLFNCKEEDDRIVDEDEIEQHFNDLADHKAVAIFSIDNRPFYTEKMQPFGIRLDVSFISLRANLMSNQGANLMLDFARKDWYEQKPVVFNVSSPSSGIERDNGKLMIGKRIPGGVERLEGYIFSEGEFRVIEFTEDRFVAEIDGKVIKPGEANIPENMKSIEGYIIAKKPPMTFDSIEKEKIFNY